MARSFKTVASALTVVLLAASRPALAGDAAAAEVLFREGKKLMEAKDYVQACPKLEASFREDEATGTLLALGACHEAEGRLASAWTEYTEVAARSARDGRKDREEAARKRAMALESRLSKLTVRVSAELGAIAGLKVFRDGKELSSGALGVAVPVDGGPHTVRAEAPNHEPFTQTVTVRAETDAAELVIPSLRALAAPKAPPPAPAASPAPAPAPAPSEPMPARTSILKPVGLGVLGLGVVGLGVGSVFAIQASGKNSDSNADCAGNVCGPTGLAARNDAISAGNTATIFVVAGGVLAAGGAAMFFLAPSGKAVTAAISPLPGGAAAQLSRAF